MLYASKLVKDKLSSDSSGDIFIQLCFKLEYMFLIRKSHRNCCTNIMVLEMCKALLTCK